VTYVRKSSAVIIAKTAIIDARDVPLASIVWNAVTIIPIRNTRINYTNPLFAVAG
jgi:hypothetical protein